MSNLDDLKDELAFKVKAEMGESREVEAAIEYGWIQLDAGATYGEALAAAKQILKEAA